jgi:hypothetical protein
MTLASQAILMGRSGTDQVGMECTEEEKRRKMRERENGGGERRRTNDED